MLHATTACNFSSLIPPDGSAPAALASLLFDPPGPQIVGKGKRFVINFGRQEKERKRKGKLIKGTRKKKIRKRKGKRNNRKKERKRRKKERKKKVRKRKISLV